MIAEKSPQMEKAVGVLMELSEDERTRMLDEKREWARRDMAALKRDGIREGTEIGKAEGLAEGIKIGENEKAKAIALIAENLLKTGVSATDISKATGLSVEDVVALQQPNAENRSGS